MVSAFRARGPRGLLRIRRNDGPECKLSKRLGEGNFILPVAGGWQRCRASGRAPTWPRATASGRQCVGRTGHRQGALPGGRVRRGVVASPAGTGRGWSVQWPPGRRRTARQRTPARRSRRIDRADRRVDRIIDEQVWRRSPGPPRIEHHRDDGVTEAVGVGPRGGLGRVRRNTNQRDGRRGREGKNPVREHDVAEARRS